MLSISFQDELWKRKSSWEVFFQVYLANLLVLMAGKSKGLVGLYKEMESCGEYADIRVMWEMIHSSCPANATSTRSGKRSHWGFCSRSTWTMTFVVWEVFLPVWKIAGYGNLPLLCIYKLLSMHDNWDFYSSCSFRIRNKKFTPTR